MAKAEAETDEVYVQINLPLESRTGHKNLMLITIGANHASQSCRTCNSVLQDLDCLKYQYHRGGFSALTFLHWICGEFIPGQELVIGDLAMSGDVLEDISACLYIRQGALGVHHSLQPKLERMCHFINLGFLSLNYVHEVKKMKDQGKWQKRHVCVFVINA